MLCMLDFITELAVALRRGNLYPLNHGNFDKYNTILTYEKAIIFFCHDNATLHACNVCYKHFWKNILPIMSPIILILY